MQADENHEIRPDKLRWYVFSRIVKARGQAVNCGSQVYLRWCLSFRFRRSHLPLPAMREVAWEGGRLVDGNRSLTIESINRCADVRGEASSSSHTGNLSWCISGIWGASGKGESQVVWVKTGKMSE